MKSVTEIQKSEIYASTFRMLSQAINLSTEKMKLSKWVSMSNRKLDKDNKLRFIRATELYLNGSKNALLRVLEFKYLIENV